MICGHMTYGTYFVSHWSLALKPPACTARHSHIILAKIKINLKTSGVLIWLDHFFKSFDYVNKQQWLVRKTLTNLWLSRPWIIGLFLWLVNHQLLVWFHERRLTFCEKKKKKKFLFLNAAERIKEWFKPMIIFSFSFLFFTLYAIFRETWSFNDNFLIWMNRLPIGEDWWWCDSQFLVLKL